MPPRLITPWKCVCFVVLFYMTLVVSWIVLPFPQVSWSRLPSERLWWGGKILRVYGSDELPSFRTVGVPVGDGRSVGRQAFILEFQYDRFSDELTVGGGGGGGDDGYKHKFDLANLVEVDEKNLPYTAKKFLVRVKTGDYDGINLPWFEPADSALLYWESQEGEKDWVDLPLALRVIKEETSNPRTDWVVSERTIQVVLDETTHDDDHHHQEQNNNNNHYEYDTDQSLLSISLNPSPKLREQTRHDVTKWNWIWHWFSSRQQIEKVFYVWYGHDGLGTSPSLTFPLRLVICRILVSTYRFLDDWVFAHMRNPIILFLSVLYVVFWVGMVYCLVVLACWSKRGRPNFWPWAKRFTLTRHVVKHVRPTTIEGGDEDEYDDDDEEEMARKRLRSEPTPLTSPWSFFTSSSPLDDLLVTYQVTRPFVQPISLIRRRRTRDLEGGEEVVAATSAVDVVKNDYDGDQLVGEKKQDTTI